MSAGKGHKWRKTNYRAYYENASEIEKKTTENPDVIKIVKKGKTTYVYK